MRPTLPRRTFIATGAAVAGGAVFVPLSTLTTAQTAPEELLAQIDRHLLAFATQPRGEYLRAIANALRGIAAHQVSSGMDARQLSGFRNRVREQGEAAVLLAEPNWAEVEAGARRYGLQVNRTPVPWDVRKQALDRVVQNGLAAEWRRQAALLDQVSFEIDRRHLARRQVNECVTINNQLWYMEMMMGFACLAALWGCAVCCVTATVTYYTWASTARSFGC